MGFLGGEKRGERGKGRGRGGEGEGEGEGGGRGKKGEKGEGKEGGRVPSCNRLRFLLVGKWGGVLHLEEKE